MEKRDPYSFQQGVVESVLYVIQSVFGSQRATRRFVREILEQGEAMGLVVHTGMQTGIDPSGKKRRHSAFRNLRSAHINRFTAFLASARLNSPIDDVSVLLKSHLTTHTGRAAMERVKLLSDHESLTDDARKVLENFGASLNDVNQYYRHRQDYLLRWGVVISISALIIAIVAFLYPTLTVYAP